MEQPVSSWPSGNRAAVTVPAGRRAAMPGNDSPPEVLRWTA